jgi:DNA repair photolyase
MACGHGCRYCDGRHEGYYVEGDFERDIVIRENAPEVLVRELPKLRERGPICISSGVSDAYQPVEREEQLTRRCAEVLEQSRFPVTVHTKSDLVLRDIDLWEEVHRQAGFGLYISLTWTDDSLRRLFEPHAASVEARLATLREFKARGMTIGVLAMPFVPFVGDAPEQIAVLLDRLTDVGVSFVMPALMTLKRGRQWTAFMETIDQAVPALRTEFERLYADSGPYGEPATSYARGFAATVHRLLDERGLPAVIPHRLYREQFPLYDEVQILLAQMSQLYRQRGTDTRRLDQARRRYQRWLDERRAHYNRRRSLSYRELEHELVHLARTGKLAELLANPKLTGFVAELVLERRTFDELAMKWADEGGAASEALSVTGR